MTKKHFKYSTQATTHDQTDLMRGNIPLYSALHTSNIENDPFLLPQGAAKSDKKIHPCKKKKKKKKKSCTSAFRCENAIEVGYKGY